MKPIAIALSACSAALLCMPAWGQKPAAPTYTFELSKGASSAELEVALKELGIDFLGGSSSTIVLDDESGSFKGDGINVFQVQSANQDGGAAAQGRGYLGISYEPVDGAMRIVGMMPGSGAAEAGLRVNDRITRIGKFYYGNDDFEAGVGALAAGESVEVRAVRGDKVLEVQVVLRTLEAVQGQAPVGQKLPVAPRAAEQEVRLRLTPAAPKAKAGSPVSGEWVFEADEEDCSCCPCCTECEKRKDKPAKIDLSVSPEPKAKSPRVMLGRRVEKPSPGGGVATVRVLRKALNAPEQAPGAGDHMQTLLQELRLLRKEMAGLRKDLAVMRKTMAVQAKQASTGASKAAKKKSGGGVKAKVKAEANAKSTGKAKAKAAKKKARTERKTRASKRKKQAKADRKTRQARARKRRTRI